MRYCRCGRRDRMMLEIGKYLSVWLEKCVSSQQQQCRLLCRRALSLQIKLNRRALPDFAGHYYFAAVGIDNVLHDSKP